MQGEGREEEVEEWEGVEEVGVGVSVVQLVSGDTPRPADSFSHRPPGGPAGRRPRPPVWAAAHPSRLSRTSAAV